MINEAQLVSSAKRGRDQLNDCPNASSTTEERSKDERVPKDSRATEMAMDNVTVQSEEEIYNRVPKRPKLEYVNLPYGRSFSYEELKYSLEEHDLANISRAFGSEWKFLGYILGMKEAEIDQCENDYPHRTILQIQEMFSRWKGSRKSEATMYALLEALQGYKGTVDWDLVSEVVNGYIQKHKELVKESVKEY